MAEGAVCPDKSESRELQEVKEAGRKKAQWLEQGLSRGAGLEQGSRA